MTALPHIALVDDDPAMLRALRRLLAAAGFRVHAFGSADALLQVIDDLDTDCLLLDVNMPGISGLDLQQRLNAKGQATPVVFLTGRGDIPMAVRAIQGGAVNFLTKPVDETTLLETLRAAVAVSAQEKQRAGKLTEERNRLARLTPREREVMTHVIAGKLNKQIAADLGTSEQTIKVHRMRVHEKMQVASVAELVRIAARLGIAPAGDRGES